MIDLMIRVLVIFMILIIILLLLSLPRMAHAATCFESAASVKQSQSDSWPRWTTHMKGHSGERCWYPGSKTQTRTVRKEVVPFDREGSSRDERSSSSNNATAQRKEVISSYQRIDRVSPLAYSPPAEPPLPIGYFREVFSFFMQPIEHINDTFRLLGFK